MHEESVLHNWAHNIRTKQALALGSKLSGDSDDDSELWMVITYSIECSGRETAIGKISVSFASMFGAQ